jgi:hypothetical protein
MTVWWTRLPSSPSISYSINFFSSPYSSIHTQLWEESLSTMGIQGLLPLLKEVQQPRHISDFRGKTCVRASADRP